ncbi:MAG: sterol desaturase family protein [Acidimicrobiales bacterium]
MDRAPVVGILLTIPLFAAMFGGEYLLGRMRGTNWYRGTIDLCANVSSGLWNLLVAGTGLVFVVVSYDWMVDHLAVVHLGSSVAAAVVALVLLDFGFYWLHRAMHRSNVLWQLHLVHHSGETLNLSAAFRQGGTPLSIRFVILAPTALLGVDPVLMALVGGVHLAGGYWPHTHAIDGLGPLGRIFITPSDHRVHHAVNDAYLDRNYGAWFSWWDRWFGTYVPERADDPPVFGLTHPVRTFNPLRMDLHHWKHMAHDTVHASSMADRLRIWFGPTGWRPADVAADHPVAGLPDDEARRAYVPYAPGGNRLARAWSFVETSVEALLAISLFWAISQGLPRADAVAAAGLLLFSIVTYTTAMDGRPHVGLEVGRVAIAAVLAVTAFHGAPLALAVVGFYALAVVVERITVRTPAPAVGWEPAMATASVG